MKLLHRSFKNFVVPVIAAGINTEKSTYLLQTFKHFFVKGFRILLDLVIIVKNLLETSSHIDVFVVIQHPFIGELHVLLSRFFPALCIIRSIVVLHLRRQRLSTQTIFIVYRSCLFKLVSYFRFALVNFRLLCCRSLFLLLFARFLFPAFLFNLFLCFSLPLFLSIIFFIVLLLLRSVLLPQLLKFPVENRLGRCRLLFLRLLRLLRLFCLLLLWCLWLLCLLLRLFCLGLLCSLLRLLVLCPRCSIPRHMNNVVCKK